MKFTLCLLAVLLSVVPAFHAAFQEQDKDKINPTLDPASKYKVYVPVDLEDAFIELKKMLKPELVRQMKEGPEEHMSGFHMGLGMWMRNNWGLWGGSRLAKYFNSMGIFHPDDMSGIILDSFWRHLNSQPLKLDKQVDFYQRFWKAHSEPAKKNCPLDGSLIELSMSLDESENDQFKVIHVGRCKKRNHLWAYERDKGWYRPDADLRKKIDEP